MTFWIMMGLMLVLVHGLAVGAYLTRYKLQATSTLGMLTGTVSIGAVYSLVTAMVICAVMFIHP